MSRHYIGIVIFTILVNAFYIPLALQFDMIARTQHDQVFLAAKLQGLYLAVQTIATMFVLIFPINIIVV